ncbi:hypothetical protein GCM10025783_05730 [Amnibacterium soli]|uniref:Uncharacterized protein n=1 Tax=Amnibacterium soli TaxID=1282736 RepID=A0ABP8YW83_9MICO
MSEPTVVARDALAGTRVGFSVSESADLGRLGLTELHCQLVVAEVTRAVLLAGGTVVYGGRLKPEGYTQIMLEEAQRFQDGTASIEIVLAETEFQKLTVDELDAAQQRLGRLGRIRYILAEGREVPLSALPTTPRTVSPIDALTAMRRIVTQSTDARVLVGGKLRGYAGREPGLIEEARLSIEHGAVLYAVAGFGGAAAAVSLARASSRPAWMPSLFPDAADTEPVQNAMASLHASARAPKSAWDGLDDADRELLERTHRPADIATLVVRGLANVGRRRA